MPDLPVWLNGQEAAAHVGVSWPALREFVIDHEIPHLKFGRVWRFNTAVLQEHLDRLAELQVTS